jgi:CBS domain-containing protein
LLEDQDAEESARLIPEHQILRLVILNLAQQLIGVISLDDLDL